MTEKELVEAYWKGGKIVTVNAAYQWCIDHNLKPSATVMLDARAFNARFIETPVPDCKYLLASQCHPSVFELCINRETLIWHACSCGDKEFEILKAYYFGRTHPITIGVTVGIRAISILRLLGFTDIVIFGLDSCWLDNKHHSYEQPENNDRRTKVWLRPEERNGKALRDDKALQFECAPWHMRQAADFQQLIRERGDLFRLDVRGPGLIAAILRTSAELQVEGATHEHPSLPEIRTST